MKILFVLIILLVPVFSYAFQCQNYEYAELKDMSKESFEAEYCKVTETIKKTEHLITKYHPSIDNEIWRQLESCSDVRKKMKRVYNERFKKEIPKCPEANAKVKE